MRRGLRGRCGAVAAASLLWAAAATTAAAAMAEQGRAIYEGRQPLKPVAAATGAAPAPAAACVACHRPSGMGNFEGGLAVPPIAGPTLFTRFDRDTSRFFAASSRWRVRPAYDQGSLGRLLRTGVTPDGVRLHPAMPRYDIDDDELAALTAYLSGLSRAAPPGLHGDTVRLATITTPDADPVRRDAMLATLARFVAQKNGQSRQEAQRSVQSQRTREMVMYRKFRVWELTHWALQGEPSSWGAQLDALQARQPVYALVAGIGRSSWEPIDAFCQRMRVPCLLPLVEAGGGTPGFYSLHYHAGIDHDARLAAQALRQRGLTRVELWSEPAAAALAERVRVGLERERLQVVASGAPAVVSLLPPEAQAARLRSEVAPRRPVAWLAGTHALGRAELAATVPWAEGGIVITPMRTGDELDRQLQRARLWLKSQNLPGLPADVAASALQAATALGEGLAHVDFSFTPEYMLELLEHGLENLVPWSPYPRLSIGPDQRVASKGSWLGEVRDGRVDWRWQGVP